MEERDLRQLLKHRHTLVQMRTRVKNQLQHIALNQGLQKKSKLWSREGQEWLKKLELAAWTQRRRDDLLQMLEDLDQQVKQMNQEAEKAAAARKDAAGWVLSLDVGRDASRRAGRDFCALASILAI